MEAILVEVLLILALTAINGLLSMSEIAVVSARRVRLQQRAEEGDRGAQAALALADDPNRFLSTVQIGITLVGILAGAFGGATIAEQLGASIGRIAALAPYADAIGLALVVLAITYLSLVFGELVPKRLALGNAERIAAAVAGPMRGLSAIASPLVHLLSASTGLVVRTMGVQPSAEPPVTEGEVEILMEEGTEVGVFVEAEREIVKRVFRLADRRASSLMTHRTDIVWLDLDDPSDRWVEQVAGSSHSRFPVAQGSLDNVIGIVRSRDLLGRCITGGPLDIKAALYPPLFVPEGTPALETLERLRESGLPMALVIDEHGGLEGLLTLTDILEALVGDVPPVGEPAEPEAVQRPDGSWLMDGLLPIDEFKETLQIDELPGEADGHFETLGGFVMASLGRIPVAADRFKVEGYCVEVMDMDGMRVDKVLVTPSSAGMCDGGTLDIAPRLPREALAPHAA